MGGLFGGNDPVYVAPPRNPAPPPLPTGWSWLSEGVRGTSLPTGGGVGPMSTGGSRKSGDPIALGPNLSSTQSFG